MVSVRRDGMVSPMARSRGIVSPAKRPSHLNDASVGLVDSMVNPKAGWGRGILDAVEKELKRRWPRLSTERISRPQLGIHEPLRWAAAMAAKYAAVVIAVGD